MRQPVIAILSGGVSGEKEVSQRSASAMLEALRNEYETEFFEVNSRAIPEGLDPKRHVVFSALHGVFGEDGRMQRLLEEAGFSYSGSDAVSSALCMDKVATKRKAAEVGVRGARGFDFDGDAPPEAAAFLESLGERIVLKPNNEGSSIGLHFVTGEAELRKILGELGRGRWLAEEWVVGREVTIGVLHGRGLGVVEILPQSGRYDYQSKYTQGMTEYRFPADISEKLRGEFRNSAEKVFQVCGCRDFARVDSMMNEEGELIFLEINTLPGLTATSLLPKSASCENLDFPALARELVAPAVARFQNLVKDSSS